MTAPHILVVDDEIDIREMLEDILTDEGYRVSLAQDAASARRLQTERRPDLILLDIWMPDTDGVTLLREWAEGGLPCRVVMMSGHGTVDTAVEATRLGASEFLEKPLSMAKLLSIVENALSEQRPGREDRTRSMIPPLTEPVGKSRVMQSLREQVRQIADHEAAVMFVGEPGTGRETLARYLHELGHARNRPFVNVVLSALNEDNAEVRLFGEETEQGVRPGWFDEAAGGSLFLNELSDMNPKVQRLVLSALEAGEYVRVGGSGPVPLDVRLISSAQPGLGRQVEEGRLRRDLYTHLNVVPVNVPPLRDYREDVPDLLRYYVDVLVDTDGLPFRRFSVAAQNRLRNYPWPGNIREVRNMVHRFLIRDGDEVVSLAEVEDVIGEETAATEREPLVKQDLLSLPLREAREHFERAYLEQQLALCGGRVGKLADRVGMERTHLYRKLRSLGIDIKKAG